MKFHPTLKVLIFLCVILLTFSINYSCSKDQQLLQDAVLIKPIETVEDTTREPIQKDTTQAPQTIFEEEEALTEEDLAAKVLETRTTIFPSINDAHVQGDNGYDQNIVRVEEGRRVSYLMFDLSPIYSIGGTVDETDLEFTIVGDNGNGTIYVFKGESNNWSEEEINTISAPKPGSLLGELSSGFDEGSTLAVPLDTSMVDTEILTLVLVHEEGNDLAFASKEHPSGKGPSLVVTYTVPQNAEAIVFDEEIVALSTETPTTETEAQNQAQSITGENTPDAQTTEVETPENTSETAQGETTEENIKPISETPEAANTTNESQPQETAAGETPEEEVSTSEAGTQAPTKSEADAPENGAPMAVAGASPTSGSAPLKVTFRGSNSTDDQGIEQYVWDFRDGSTSNEANPTHTFEKTGTLEVRLTVTDAQGAAHTDSVTISITEEEKENEAPLAIPKASPASGEAPLEVRFTGDESTDDNSITKFGWDFKDGSFASTANATHTFDEPGEYQVVLNVEDEKGLSNARVVVVTVTEAENEAPVAVASGSPLTGDAPLDVKFRGSDSKDDEGITGYFWDFKDGSTTTSSNPSHTFSDPGEYAVELSVKDAQGLTHETTINVKVNQPPVSSGGSGGGTSGSGGSSSGSSGSSGNTGGSGSNSNPSNGVKASSFGYNSSDATQALEKAIESSYSTIIVDKQSSDWVVGPLWFKKLRNKTIIFETGVVLRAKRGSFRPQDRLFQLEDSDNIEIQGYGATFAMNRSEYSGQQNHALSIINSSNISVKGLILTGAGGDGIYVSRRDHGEYCRNIIIDGVTSTKNQRQGITVVSIDGLQIKNSTFSETSGQSPSAGIDFEPEDTSDRLDNITVSNCTFKDNHGPGIMFAVNKANSSTRPIDATFKNIKVSNNSINNPRLYPTEIELGMSSAYTGNPVKGTITFDGLTVENSNWSAIYTKKTLEAYHVNVKNAVIKNVSKNGKEAAIHIGLLGYGSRSNANMGGFTFENVLIDYNGQAPSLELFGPGHGNWDLGNLRGEIRVRSPRGARLTDNMNKLSISSSSVNLRVVED